jgi:repressor LexA
MSEVLSPKRKAILDFIAATTRDRGYPPSVREIGEHVGLTSSATVHSHLAVLQREGFLYKDPTKPRAIQVRYDAASPAPMATSPLRHVPLLGAVAAGTGVLADQHVDELMPLPEVFTGSGNVFMLKVRGESMVDLGIFDGDYVVVREQQSAENGEIVVAGIPGEEATVKSLSKTANSIVLIPANPAFSPMEFSPEDVVIYGKVVTVIRSL